MDFILNKEPGKAPHLYLPSFGGGKARAIFTTRCGGVSQGPYTSLNLGFHTGDSPEAVTTNRHLLARSLGIKEERFFTLSQVHGDRVVVIDTERDLMMKKGTAADGVITSLKNTAVAICCADCQAIYLYDPVKEVISVAHAGWRGNVARIALNCLQEMTRVYGSRPQDCCAALSPAAGDCCYEVGDQVYTAVRDAFPGSWQNLMVHKDHGKWHLSLSRANALVLMDAGVMKENIFVSNLCTICRQDLFFSYRGSAGVTGRMAAILIQ